MAQQQWASQYVKWDFQKNLDVWNIDQQVWIYQSCNHSFWPLQWSWKDMNETGGYLGLQQNSNDVQNIRFSLWNAIGCRSKNCIPFEGEGEGYTCVLPIIIDRNKFYRYRLWRQESDSEGVWWCAWLIEEFNGTLVEHFIGSIKVPLSCYVIDPYSICNFVEYWGDNMICTDLPMSIVGFTPPAVNYCSKGSGTYERYYTYAGSSKAVDNYCGTQQQQFGNGALITAQPYDFGFANGVVMFLGGNNPNPTFVTS